MKKRIVASLLSVAMIATLAAGCAGPAKEGEDVKGEEVVKQEESTETEDEKDDTQKPEKKIEVESASIEQVQAFMKDSDEKTVLVDARPQENYSGWALEGAKNGGHLKNAVLFSARWIDCEYAGEAPREAYLKRAMEDQNITKDAEVIVYDYTGE